VNVDPFDSRLESPESARGSPASSSRACRRPSATRCRSPRPTRRATPGRAGGAARWFLRPEAHVSAAGRLADGLSPAARLARVGRRRRTFRTSSTVDPFAAARAVAATLGAHQPSIEDRTVARPLPTPRATCRRAAGSGAPRPALRSPMCRPVQASRLPTRSDRRLRRAARREAARLHAAARQARRLSRHGGGDRGRPPRSSASRCWSRATIRRATRGFGSSRSRPTPASSR
jgi:hypothetical protein